MECQDWNKQVPFSYSFFFVIFEKEKTLSARNKECHFTVFMSEVVVKAKSSIQEGREVFLK